MDKLKIGQIVSWSNFFHEETGRPYKEQGLVVGLNENGNIGTISIKILSNKRTICLPGSCLTIESDVV